MLFLSIICDSCLYEQDYDPDYQFQICDNCGNNIDLNPRDAAEQAGAVDTSPREEKSDKLSGSRN